MSAEQKTFDFGQFILAPDSRLPQDVVSGKTKLVLSGVNVEALQIVEKIKNLRPK